MRGHAKKKPLGSFLSRTRSSSSPPPPSPAAPAQQPTSLLSPTTANNPPPLSGHRPTAFPSPDASQQPSLRLASLLPKNGQPPSTAITAQPDHPLPNAAASLSPDADHHPSQQPPPSSTTASPLSGQPPSAAITAQPNHPLPDAATSLSPDAGHQHSQQPPPSSTTATSLSGQPPSAAITAQSDLPPYSNHQSPSSQQPPTSLLSPTTASQPLSGHRPTSLLFSQHRRNNQEKLSARKGKQRYNSQTLNLTPLHLLGVGGLHKNKRKESFKSRYLLISNAFVF